MSNKKKFRNSISLGIFIVFLSVLIFSCEKYQFEPPQIDPNEEISFAEVIIPIFENRKCIDCHKGSVPPDLRKDKAYSSLTKTTRYIGTDPENKPEDALIYTKLKEGHSSDVTEIELLQILYWVKQGAQNN